MKILVACFLLSTIALTYAKYPFPINYKELFEGLVNKEKHVSAEVESDDIDDDVITDLQGMFSVLEQIEMEKAKQMQYDDNGAKAQLWGGLGTILWKTGKGYLKNRYCTQEAEVRAMIEELVDETSDDNEDAEEDNDKFTELRNLIDSLNQLKMQLNQFQVIDGDVAMAEGWFKKVRKSIKKKAKKVARKVLC
jgi:hypothetical protein